MTILQGNRMSSLTIPNNKHLQFNVDIFGNTNSNNNNNNNTNSNRARSERALSLALPQSSLLDFYDRQQEQCSSVALLPTSVNTVVRRHSSHYYPMFEAKQKSQAQQQQQQQLQPNQLNFNNNNINCNCIGSISSSSSGSLMATKPIINVEIKTPRLYYDSSKTDNLIMEDIPILKQTADASNTVVGTAARANAISLPVPTIVNNVEASYKSNFNSQSTLSASINPPPIPKRTFRAKSTNNTGVDATLGDGVTGDGISVNIADNAIQINPNQIAVKNKQKLQQLTDNDFIYSQPQKQFQFVGNYNDSSILESEIIESYSDITPAGLVYGDCALDSGGISDDDRLSLENSVFDESITSTPVKLGTTLNTSLNSNKLLANKHLTTLSGDLSNATKRLNRSSNSTVDSAITSSSLSSGYGSHSERLPSASNTMDFRSRFSSVDTQSSLDGNFLAEKPNEQQQPHILKERGFMQGELNNMQDFNNFMNNNTDLQANFSNNRANNFNNNNNNNSLGRQQTSNPELLPMIPQRKQQNDMPPKLPPPAQAQQVQKQQQELIIINNLTRTLQKSHSSNIDSKGPMTVSASNSTTSTASAGSGGMSGSSMSLSTATASNTTISPLTYNAPEQEQIKNGNGNGATTAPPPPARHLSDMDNRKVLPTKNVRNKINKNRPPPIVYPKFQQRQDSNLSSDSFSATSSPGYNSNAPLLQNAARINKSGPGMAIRHQDSNDSFNMTTSRYTFSGLGQTPALPPPRGRMNYRQDSNISSDSFSQTSSPGYNSKIMEAPLLPSLSVKRLGCVPAPIVIKQKLPNETTEELEQQALPPSPLTKYTTPTSLQTIVRFQNGTPNTMSLQHQTINRRKSSNPYITNGRLNFRVVQVLINAFALLAIGGGLAAYFNAYPTIRFVNKTIINTIRVDDTISFGKNPAPGTCLPIIVKFCQGPQIPYNYTVFPNYIGHFGQLETQVDLDAYEALVDVRCYELVSLFLCTLFVPKCGSTGATVPPCKTLCTETQRRCGFFFDVFGLSLPEYLNCKLFKDFESAEDCVGLEQVRDVMIAASNPTCDGFQCDHNRCIPKHYVCDGHLDCMDQTDEASCERCSQDEIYCGENNCISSKHICDGVVDCPHGQDERNCIRLSDRNGDLGKGVLEVFRISTREWTPACVKNWDRAVSPTVVCSMLGYSSVNATSVITQKTHRPLLTSVNVSSDIWKMYAKKRSNLMQEFSNCKPDEDYPIAELTCSNYECGKVKRERHKPSVRIIGGSQSNPGSWPFLAAILGGPEKIFYCAGVLISDQWVLTASHCIGNHTIIDLEDWTIQLGVTRRNSFTYTGQKVKVKAVIPHPQYNTAIAHDNDIALFQLATRVSFHEHLLPVCLPPPGVQKLPSEQLCTVIGWGKREDKDPKSTYEPIVNEVQVPIIKRQQCDEWLDNLTVSDGMICAGYEEGGKDACQGDSGGPLLCPYPGEKDRWFVGGIVSWGIMCAHPKLPGVYANVIKYVPWILEQIQKFSKPTNDDKYLKFDAHPGGPDILSNIDTSPVRSRKHFNSPNRSPSDASDYR